MNVAVKQGCPGFLYCRDVNCGCEAALRNSAKPSMTPEKLAVLEGRAPAKPSNAATIQIGRHHITRLNNGQLCISDGIRGTFPDEKKLEEMLTAVLENRWKL